jgi:hypothetical protein
MNLLNEPSKAQIEAEIALIRNGARSTGATPKSAAAFLKRIGVGKTRPAVKKGVRSTETEND